MKLNEWDYEFDILYNNISSNQAPPINRLEKSIILTQAQEDVYKTLYTESFEKTEEVTEYLQKHIKEHIETNVNFIGGKKDIQTNFREGNVWFIIYESFARTDAGKCDDTIISVVPATHDELNKILSNPFKRPDKRRVIRILWGDKIYLYYLNGATGHYTVRYLTKPEPIILPNIHQYMEGDTQQTCGYEDYWVSDDKGQNCEFPESLHRTILERAVQIAKAAWA